jgi:hypothetical protein
MRSGAAALVRGERRNWRVYLNRERRYVVSSNARIRRLPVQLDESAELARGPRPLADRGLSPIELQ